MKKETKASGLSIADWSKQDRPREKFMEKGISSLSDAELIAILLRTGTASENAVDLARRLLSGCGNQLHALASCSLKTLLETKGIGVAKAVTLHAAFEIGNRIRAEKVMEAKRINSILDVVELMQDKIANLPHEEFWAVYLNQAGRILDVRQIGKGSLTDTLVDIRTLVQYALDQRATSIIVCHNHPSGAMRPSQADIRLTHQIQDASRLFKIALVDHVILHKDAYYSFANEGLLSG